MAKKSEHKEFIMKKTWLAGGILLSCLCGHADDIVLQNPSFEKGTGGYWINKPAQAAIDTSDSTKGKQCLCIAGDGKTTVNTVLFTEYQPETVYQLSFDVKGEGQATGPEVQVKLMMQGKKPIAFWSPKGEQADMFKPFTPAQQWQSKTLSFGPIPATLQGKDIRKIGIFFDTQKGSGPGKVWFDGIALTTSKAAEAPQKKK
jgi:hypothetical protein